MKCPHCNVNLVMSEKQEIEIDYCPECRGIWLDRGELDKIVERSNMQTGSSNKTFSKSDYYEPKPNNYENDYKHKSHKKNKMTGFLEDIFDFG